MDCKRNDSPADVDNSDPLDKTIGSNKQTPSKRAMNTSIVEDGEEFLLKRKLPNETDQSKDNQSSEQDLVETNVNLTKVNPEEEKYEADAIELAIERINALQDELKMHSFDDESDSDLEDEDYLDEDDNDLGSDNIDAKTLGFIACAQETMKYLTNQGISRDDPMMVNLRNRLIEEINRI